MDENGADFSEFDFYFYDNSRLDFGRSREVVQGFIRDRLSAFGAKAPVFLPNREMAIQNSASPSVGSGKFAVVVDCMNPILDFSLIARMSRSLLKSDASRCYPRGAIPGTEPDFVVRQGAKFDGEIFVEWESQAIHNNQFNLYKFKRIKMFIGLANEVPGLVAMPIEVICKKLKEDKLHNRLISYFENVKSKCYENCPWCDGELHGLKAEVSQPLIGFLSSQRPCYFECVKCGLILLSPAPIDSHVSKLYDSFDSQDFVKSETNGAAFVLGRRRCDLSSFDSLLPAQPSSLDLGGGVGHFSSFLKANRPDWDVTHSDFGDRRRESLSNEGIRTRQLNFLEEEIGFQEYDLISAWEVIEHIPFERLGDVFEKINKALRPGGVFVFSTPNFDSPFCRAFDFFNLVVPHHLTVLREKWIREFVSKKPGWEIFEIRHTSDLLDNYEMWFDYFSKTSRDKSSRALADILGFLMKKDPKIQYQLLEAGWGTEVIFTLRKTTHE